eukprot:Awhi_evm1s10023
MSQDPTKIKKSASQSKMARLGSDKSKDKATDQEKMKAESKMAVFAPKEVKPKERKFGSMNRKLKMKKKSTESGDEKSGGEQSGHSASEGASEVPSEAEDFTDDEIIATPPKVAKEEIEAPAAAEGKKSRRSARSEHARTASKVNQIVLDAQVAKEGQASAPQVDIAPANPVPIASPSSSAVTPPTTDISTYYSNEPKPILTGM